MSWRKIAELIGISERTLRTKRQSFRDQNSVGYSQVNDEQLDSFLRDIQGFSQKRPPKLLGSISQNDNNFENCFFAVSVLDL